MYSTYTGQCSFCGGFCNLNPQTINLLGIVVFRVTTGRLLRSSRCLNMQDVRTAFIPNPAGLDYWILIQAEAWEQG